MTVASPSRCCNDWLNPPSIRDSLTRALAEPEADASVGSRGCSYALAEARNSLLKAECICNPVILRSRGWEAVVDVEIVVAEYVDWFNHRGRHSLRVTSAVACPPGLWCALPSAAEAYGWSADAQPLRTRLHHGPQ